MRQELKNINELRKTFFATFSRYGTKRNWNGFPEITILLIDVREMMNNELVADHIWFRMTKGFEKIGELKEGNKIRFDARVKQYIKGWHGGKAEKYGEESYEEDYKLSFPTRIMKL